MSDPAPATRSGPDRRWVAVHLGLPVALLGAVWLLRDVLTPILVSLFFAYALSPAVDRLERRRIPRSVGAGLVLFVLVAGVLGLVVGLLPSIVAEFHRFVARLPELLERLARETLPGLERSLGIDLPDDLNAALGALAERVRGSAPEAMGPLARAAAGAVMGALEFLGALLGLLVIPILTYFFLRDFPRMVAAVQEQIPRRIRPGVEAYAREVDEILSGYLRGQLLVVLCQAVLYALGLWAIGLRLGPAIGILAGLLAFLPYAGFAVGLALAVLMALVTFADPWTYVGIGAVFAGVQALEGFVLTPWLVGRRIGLGMVWILVALMVFGATLGFVGVLLAVPLAAVFRTSLRRLLAYRAALDRADAGDPPPETPAGPAADPGTAVPAAADAPLAPAGSPSPVDPPPAAAPGGSS